MTYRLINTEAQHGSRNRHCRRSACEGSIKRKVTIGHDKQTDTSRATKSRATTDRNRAGSQIRRDRTPVQLVAVRRGQRTDPGIVCHYSGADQEGTHPLIATDAQLATAYRQGTGSQSIVGRGAQVAIVHQRASRVGVALRKGEGSRAGDCECVAPDNRSVIGAVDRVADGESGERSCRVGHHSSAAQSSEGLAVTGEIQETVIAHRGTHREAVASPLKDQGASADRHVGGK